MRLKRVQIFGFKTFADRTEIDLDGGLVAVTGPNGCGKSNLVDAILWALGESSAKNLRAAAGQDVIFGGSQRRKPIGYAEVSLLFDNEDGALPVPFPEVSITRRLTRAGESEFQINRQNCRLRDIHELLADSGLGRSGYAIVGQKDIDQALSASAEERRTWIDEAAGVMRYRARKLESLRKLGQAESHLERVSDIVGELERQREPLREEAEIAIRYKEIAGALRGVETKLLSVELCRSKEELAKLDDQTLQARRLSAKETGLADSLEAQEATLVGRLRSARTELEMERDRELRATGEADSAVAAARLGRSKLEGLGTLESSMGEESALADARLAEAAQELASAKLEFAAEAELLQSLRAEMGGMDEAALTLRQRLSECEQALSAARARAIESHRLEAQRSHAGERQKEVRRELGGIEKTIGQFAPGLAEAEAALKERQHELDKAKENLKACEAKIKTDRERLQASDRELRDLLGQLSSLEARIQALEASISSHEGLGQGARAVLDLVDEGSLPNEYEPVGEAIRIRPQYANAMEAALGASVNDLIVPDEAAAKAAIELLKAGRLGRATFQPITLMRPQAVSRELESAMRSPGVVGRGSELVDCENRIRPVVESLLGRIVVVETLDHALRMAKSGGWSRLVTLDGEVVNAAGAVTGGTQAKGGFGLIQRKAALEAALEERSKAEKGLASLQKFLAQSQEEQERMEAEREEHVQIAQAAASEAIEAERWLQGLRQEEAGTRRELDRLKRELETLEASLAGELEEVDLAAFEAARDAALMDLAARTADADAALARLKDLEERAERASQSSERAEARHKSLVAQREARERKIANLAPEKEVLEAEIESSLAEAEAKRAEADAHGEQLMKLSRDIEHLEAEQERLHQGVANARLASREHEQAAHESELQRARVDARRAAAVQRLADEYSMTEDDALAFGRDAELPSDASTLVSRLRRELRGFGDVNLGAIESYERLTTRHDELSAQMEDIENGAKELRQVIRELDVLTRDRFAGTFEQVAVAFKEVFAKLFDGGEAALSLSAPDNLLETGIDIEVTLPGKKRQRLELLSGGERSLCATAFLFALLKVKPSPLVILDEVDAPLDGRNVERYVKLLDEFDQIQFLVITHNPTTIQSAPIWLGVTMAEPGVSTLVPARLSGKGRTPALVG